MDKNTIDIIIQGKELISKEINAVGKAVDNLKEPVTASSNALKAMGGVLSMITAAAAAIGISKLADEVMELTKRGGQFVQVQAGFKRSFKDTEKSLNNLRKASKGTISDYDLMLTSNKAALLGVTKNSKELAQIMTTARLRAKELGMTTTQAFEDIVTGIGRGSPLILDNLGIKIPAAFQKATEKMTETQKRQALVNLVIADGKNLMKQYGGDTVSAADKTEQFNVKMANFRDTLAVKLLPSLERLIDVAIKVADALLPIADAIASIAESISGITLEKQTAEMKKMVDLAKKIDPKIGEKVAEASKKGTFATVGAVAKGGASVRKQAGQQLKSGALNIAKLFGIKKFARGGEYMTRRPELIMVGDNPGGREHVSITPTPTKPSRGGVHGITFNNYFPSGISAEAVAARLMFQFKTI